MKYEYKVIFGIAFNDLETVLNYYGDSAWKAIKIELLSATWNVVFEKEIDYN